MEDFIILLIGELGNILVFKQRLNDAVEEPNTAEKPLKGIKFFEVDNDKVELSTKDIQLIQNADAIIYFNPLPALKAVCESHRIANNCVAIESTALWANLIPCMISIKSLHECNSNSHFLARYLEKDKIQRDLLIEKAILVNKACSIHTSLFSWIPKEIIDKEFNSFQIGLVEPELWFSTLRKPIWNRIPRLEKVVGTNYTRISVIPTEEELSSASWFSSCALS